MLIQLGIFQVLRFRITVLILSVVPLLTGAIDFLLGASAINALGPPLSESSSTNATLNSQIRFFGAIWMSYGVALIVVALDITKYAALFRMLAAFLFLSGIARLISIVQFGIPAPPLIGATAVELIMVPILYVWHAQLIRN